MTPTDEPNLNELDQARSDLHEGIVSSLEIVRQSRLLIELSESDPAFVANDDAGAFAE